jgi:hypothetical protein
MQTADITAINAAKSIGSSPHHRAIGPMLAQSDSVGRNPEPDGPMYSQIIAGMIHCRLRRGSAVTQTQSVARRVPGGSSFPKSSRAVAGGKNRSIASALPFRPLHCFLFLSETVTEALKNV